MLNLRVTDCRPVFSNMSHSGQGVQISHGTRMQISKIQGNTGNHQTVVPQRSSTPILSNLLKSGPGSTRPTYTPRDENPPGSVTGISKAQRRSPVSIRRSPVSDQKATVNADKLKPKPKLSQGSPSYGSSRGALYFDFRPPGSINNNRCWQWAASVLLVARAL